MVQSETIKIYLEQNRTGKLKRIETYKDKDKEDTTLTFWVKLPDGSLAKAGEYIVKEDQSLPHQCGDNEHWDDVLGKCVPNPPAENKAPIIEGPTLLNARVGSPLTVNVKVSDPEADPVTIAWRQTLPTPLEYPDFANKETIDLTYEAEGDYLIQCEAKDDHNNITDLLINVKAREQQVPPPTNFKNLLSHTADDDDNSTGIKSISLAGKAAPMVLFGGDGPYNESNPQGFIDAWQKNVSKEHTAIAVRGNHDTLEDSNQKTKDAMDQYFGWPSNKPANQAMKVNNVGLLGIDTDDSKIGDKNGDQYKFIAATLEELDKDTAIDFIICVMHKPIYSHGYKHSDEKSLRSVYGPLFAKYNVDIVLESHNHNFWMTYPLDAEGVAMYNEISEAGAVDIIYNFQEPHGVLFWGDGSGGHDLYTVGSKVPSFIRAYNDKDFGICEIAIDENNPKNLRIRNVSQAGKVLHSVQLRKGQTGPADKQPPAIVGGPPNDNLIVEPSGSVALAFNIYDQDGGTVNTIDWQFNPPDKVVTPIWNPSGGPYTSVQFMAPQTEGDIEARITATDNDGLSSGKTVLIHVRKTPPADDLTGVEVFDSVKNWTPPDGKDHFIILEVGGKDHKDGNGSPDGWILPWEQPQAITYMSNAHSAGDDPKSCKVTKDGHLHIRNNQHRTYTDCPNYNFRDVTKVKWPKGGIDNVSKKGRNEHELGPADNKKKGIAGLGWHRGKDYYGGKKEIVHGTNDTLKGDTKTTALKVGDLLTMQMICFDEKQKDGKIWVRFIYFETINDGELKKVAEWYDKNPSPAELDSALYYKKASMWNRVNGAENQGDDEYLEIIQEQIFDLGPEPRLATS